MTHKERYEKAKAIYDEWIKLYPFTLNDLDGEIWKPIPEYEEFYHVSNFGRMKSFKYKKQRIVKPQLSGGGYLHVGLHRGNKQKIYHVHNLVAKIFLVKPEGKYEVNHIDGCKLNCYVGNLEWKTHAENQQHAFDTGLQKSGESRSDSFLTNEQVEWCRKVYKARDKEFSAKALAEKFGVNAEIIRLAVRGKTYKAVGGTHHEKYGVPGSICEEIRRLYVRGSTEFGTVALAKKFGYAQNTIWKIVNER